MQFLWGLLTGLLVGGGLATLYFVVGVRMLKRNRPAPVVLGEEDVAKVSVFDYVDETNPTFEDQTFVVRLSDWGPDFTGTDDLLPRWRWVLFHEGSDPVNPEMLGNAPTMEEAIDAATEYLLQWWPGAMLKVEDPA